MKKIEAIIRPEKLEAVVSALESFGHIGLNIQDVKGHGRQKGMKELFRGQEYEIRFVPKVKVEIVIGDDKVDKAIELIVKTAQTGQIGDGKIFISDLVDAVRVRTAEHGDGVLSRLKEDSPASGYAERIEAIDPSTDRHLLIAELKREERDFFEGLKGRCLGPWSFAKGRTTAASLTAFRDSVLKRLVRFAGGLDGESVLIATGGYGRGELSPYSDIDICFLYTGREGSKEKINEILYLFWDMGYNISHSVRTVREALKDVLDDRHFLNSLLESRLLSGNEGLFTSCVSSLRDLLPRIRLPYLRSVSDETYGIMEDSCKDILCKEPDLKNNPGGLRSLHLVLWLNRVFYGNGDPAQCLKESGSGDARKYFAAYDFILHLRNMLHFLTSRKEDILYIDYQKELAGYLGIKGEGDAPFKALMKKYYTMSHLVFFCRFSVVDSLSFGNLERHKLRGYSEGYYVVNGSMRVHGQCALSAEKALDFVKICAARKLHYSFSLLEYLKKANRELGGPDVISPGIMNRFVAILSLDNAYYGLNLMKLSGLLYKVLPPFGRIRHLTVYNPAHSFTVDQHSLEAVKVVEALADGSRALNDQYAFLPLTDIFRKYCSHLWIVKLSLLLHDVGKAHTLDHVKNGLDLIRGFFEDYPISSFYKSMIAFLIEHHLLLSHIIHRTDINDRDVIADLTRTFILTPFPEDYFDFLFLVTYADISATNGRNFSGYISELLFRVYSNIQPLLQGNSQVDRLEEEVLLKLNELRPDVRDFAVRLGEKYVFATEPADMEEDLKIVTAMRSEPAEVRYKARLYNECLRIRFYSQDRPGLFAFLCGILLLNGADVVRASIHTLDTVALDEFHITRIFGLDFPDFSEKNGMYEWTKTLEKAIGEYSRDPVHLALRVEQFKKRIFRVPQVFRKRASILVRHKSETESAVEISCTDRPALLYEIASFLSRESLNVLSARIDTSGWDVHDHFEVTHHSLTAEDFQNKLDSLMKIGDNDGV